MDTLTDALAGIAEGVYDAAKTSDVLDNIPESLPNGLSIPTVAYLQGGNPQYFTLSQDVYLKDVSMTVVTLGLMTSDIDSLEFYGCRAVRVTYSPDLEFEDSIVPEDMLVQDSSSGHYTVFRIPWTDWNNTAEPEYGGNVAQYSYDLQASSCIVPAIGALWGEEPTPYNKGHYLNPFEAISHSAGGISGGVFSLPFLSSSGIQFSVPFTVNSPSATTITGNKWEKIFPPSYTAIKRDSVAQPFLGRIGGQPPVGKKPKPEYIRELKGTKTNSGVVAIGTAVALLWIMGRKRK
jgi:hypothetical protein